jgi:tetratricopeptide (TPR) repeat protein
MTFSQQQIVKTLLDAGLVEDANIARLAQWKTTPQLLPCTADDLELIAKGHTKLDVCLILNQILNGNQTCNRPELLQQFYRSAEQLVAVDQKHRAMLVRVAKNHLATDGALGEIVHFLLTNAKMTNRQAKRDMIFALLERIATGKTDATYLDRTIIALTKSVGIVHANRELERLIDRYPTALPLWAARVALRQRLDNDPVALTELRTVLTHALDPNAELSFLATAAAQRKLTPDDSKRMSKLPAELLASPQGEYVQGLIALRQGNADEAIERLLKAAPQTDGRHLYELALAYTESSAKESRENAIATLERLSKRYPKSSLARNARSFVRQLTPQPAIASDIDENR